jgi:trk system potassium uptake protein TrkH
LKRDTKTVLSGLGLVLHVPGFMALASLPVCLWFEEWYALLPFFLVALVSFASGQSLYRPFRHDGETQLRHAMMIAALAWVTIPVIGSLPYLAIASYLAALPDAPRTVLLFQSPWNALFEAVSGFTATGLTMSLRPSQLPYSLQWWRSFTEWVGGVGIIVLMLAVVKARLGARYLYRSEAREEKILPSVTSTVRMIWWIYLLYTGLSVLLLRVVGMSWWAALNHGMTGIATGGFSLADRGVAEYSADIQVALIAIMLIGAISFAVHYELLWEWRWDALWHDAQHKSLYSMTALGAVLLFLENYWATGSLLWLATAFQWVSALATAGFQTVDLRSWSSTAQIMLIVAMIAGGAAGSTAGGLKQVRVVVISKSIYWSFRRIVMKPHELMRYEIDGQGLSEEQALQRVDAASVMALMWLALLLVATLTLLHFVPAEFTPTDVGLEVASALGNVGLSTGVSHPDLAWPAKLTLILAMWIGRLEVFPVLILCEALFRKRD